MTRFLALLSCLILLLGLCIGVGAAIEVTGRQQMNIMELANGNGMDSELQQALTTELQNSATSLLINVITAAPQQVQTLMNEVTNMMNNQQNDYDDYDYDYDYDY